MSSFPLQCSGSRTSGAEDMQKERGRGGGII